MWLLKYSYEKLTGKEAPYYYDYSLMTIIKKPIRKFVAQVIAPNCPFNDLRVQIYRMCGFKIGKGTFIGMKCYLDDMCYDKLVIGSSVIISYGVYFACHGRNQGHYQIVIEDGVYIGMRSSIISKNRDKNKQGVIIGKDAIIGSNCLVNIDIPDNNVAVGIPCRLVGREIKKDESFSYRSSSR